MIVAKKSMISPWPCDKKPPVRPRRYHEAARRLALVAGLLGPVVSNAATPGPRAYAMGDPAIDALQDVFRPTLESNRKEFQGRFTRVQGFRAGAGYPQLWVRDGAGLAPLSRYLYPRGYLTSWLEEMLAHQQPDGSLYDWIAAGRVELFNQWAPHARELFQSGPLAISADKNTTEADQETSAVDAAFRAWRATGDNNWLKRSILGSSVIERCASAVRYLTHERYDTRLGLVTSAFTADWGDVSLAYGDQRAIYLDDATPLVAGLYTNSLVARAMAQLGDMYAAIGNATRASEWRAQADLMRRKINRHFWQADLGFYRMNLVLRGSPRVPPVGETDGILALGGNSMALLAGIPSDAQARRLFDVAESRRLRFGLTTVSGVLLPPFPDGVFLHPALAREWQYQNGGQWDWFGGRFVLAEYERGYSRRATAHLAAIAQRVVAAHGAHEWHTREGDPKGSGRYSASAAALAEAVYEGLFGVKLVRGVLSLDIRLLDRTGRIELRQPATTTRVAYRYRFDPRTRRINLDAETNARLGRVRLVLPPGLRAREVLRAGRAIRFNSEARGDDRAVSVPGGTSPVRLEVRLSPR
jgi:Mannosylglycerate hydrolase MGH1-like glycoside hydrolase domain